MKIFEMSLRRLILTCLLTAWPAGSGLAVDFYVAQNSAGNGSGIDAADPLPLASINASWPASPGDTVHLVGVLTNLLTVGGSGLPGSPVTIYFEPNARMSAPTLANNSSWINVAGRGWITLDGGSNGVIELTDNGTVAANGGTMDYGHSGITGIYASPVNNLTIQNLVIRNLYDRQTNTEPIVGVSGAADATGVYWSGSGVTVSNCFLTGAQEMVFGIYSTLLTSNFTMVACTLSNYNHGFTLGSGGVVGPVFNNVLITHDTFQGGDMYETADGIGDLGLHRNAIFIFNESELAPGAGGLTSGSISNIIIAGNYIQHGAQPFSHTAGTGGMFFDTYNSSSTVHVRVFNNIAHLVCPLAWSGGGGFASGAGLDVLFANNTIVSWQTNGAYGGGYGWSITGSNIWAYNNINVSSLQSWLCTVAATTGFTNNNPTCAALLAGNDSDYNIFNGMNGGNGWVSIVYNANNGGIFNETIYDTLAQFRYMYGGLMTAQADPHSTTATVLLNASFQPLTNDTVAVGNGTNLTAFALADHLPGLLTDYAGNARPATGNWTIGAYQAAGTGVGNGSSSGNVAGSGSVTNSGVGGGSDITNGLILQYKFNDGSGATAADSSGNGYTGTLQGHAGWTNGVNGSAGAVSFPSNDGAFTSPDGVSASAIAYSGDWTISFWVYNYSFPGVLNYAVSPTAGTGIFVNYDNSAYTWGFYDGNLYLNGSASLSPGQWYFVAVSKSAGTNYQLYLNGSTNSAGTLANVNVLSLTIGNRSGNFEGMNGRVEDCRIYNRVLAAGEIATLNANGANYVPPVIAVTSSSQNFGTLAVGATNNLTFTVQNTGGSTLIGTASVAAPFSIVSGGTYNLTAGQSQSVTISFNPTAAGTSTQNLTFTGGTGISMALTGTAVARVPVVLPPPLQLQAHPPGQ